MPANGTSTSPSAPKAPRPNKPPKQAKPSKLQKDKDIQAHQSSTIAATNSTVKVSQNVGAKAKDKDASAGSKDGSGAVGGNGPGGKGKNKRTVDVLSLFSEKEMSAGGTIRLKPPAGAKEGSRKKPRTASQGNWKERAKELEEQGKFNEIYILNIPGRL
ncbi:hypothetical protein L211DRAFT_332516 [Terfezia boudieri ATCC MYA-4762]|uniref:Uncharacterized protein n=1 Tax=Terfezia boudieri ATCC MYA-4762 TaxID=1051890 RepID=A0A3N4LX17_9PEZI|nr:hypothetical protein L211DRAFT_332516 [Terfezia boudieri ATCC MYA-4762]